MRKLLKKFLKDIIQKLLFKEKRKFSVIFIIKNIFKENSISNGIKIEDISFYHDEREIL